jgi:hypothetical protein
MRGRLGLDPKPSPAGLRSSDFSLVKCLFDHLVGEHQKRLRHSIGPSQEHPDPAHAVALLRPRHERPRRRAALCRDEVASAHSDLLCAFGEVYRGRNNMGTGCRGIWPLRDVPPQHPPTSRPARLRAVVKPRRWVRSPSGHSQPAAAPQNASTGFPGFPRGHGCAQGAHGQGGDRWISWAHQGSTVVRTRGS